jgi:fructose-1,6-bisphosphatase
MIEINMIENDVADLLIQKQEHGLVRNFLPEKRKSPVFSMKINYSFKFSHTRNKRSIIIFFCRAVLQYRYNTKLLFHLCYPLIVL